MYILHPCAPLLHPPHQQSTFSRQSNNFPPCRTFAIRIQTCNQPKTSLFTARASRSQNTKTQNLKTQIAEHNDDYDGDFEGEEGDYEGEDGFSSETRFGGREEEKDYDRDPEFAEILGSCLDDPAKARTKMEERLRKKRNKILHTKTGSATPMRVTFNKFDFSNSYIWFEFYNIPLPKDVSLICDTIRAWHILGRLGGCNSLNMQLSQSPMDKRPSYDAVQGANATPTTFYNIGDLELQENLARICYVGIKQLVFGGSEFENWREGLTSDDAGYNLHKI